MRRGARITVWTIAAIVLLVLLFLGWLLYTESGRDYVLGRALGSVAEAVHPTATTPAVAAARADARRTPPRPVQP